MSDLTDEQSSAARKAWSVYEDVMTNSVFNKWYDEQTRHGLTNDEMVEAINVHMGYDLGDYYTDWVQESD